MPLRFDIGDFPVPPPTYTTSIGARFFSSGSSSEMIQLLFNVSQLTAMQTKFKRHTTQSWKWQSLGLDISKKLYRSKN